MPKLPKFEGLTPTEALELKKLASQYMQGASDDGYTRHNDALQVFYDNKSNTAQVYIYKCCVATINPESVHMFFNVFSYCEKKHVSALTQSITSIMWAYGIGQKVEKNMIFKVEV